MIYSTRKPWELSNPYNTGDIGYRELGNPSRSSLITKTSSVDSMTDQQSVKDTSGG